MSEQPTIFALSSGQGRAAVAVVRVSGPAAGTVLDRMGPPRPKPRMAGFRRLRHPMSGAPLDDALVLWFPAPRSETGEDMAELQVHGGRAVVKAVLQALGDIPGCRLADPGEFTRRAFENGKLDLTAAEGLADLVDAETEQQRRQALSQAAGGQARLYEGWRACLLEATALVEAAIDFSDEHDVAGASLSKTRAIVSELLGELRRHLDDGYRGEILRDGFRVVLAGPPNVGKSSLFNALARREAAIVSEEAGTTRDVIEVRLDLEGLPIVLSDTAGIRDTPGRVEQEGVRRAIARAGEADLVLWLMDAQAPVATLPGHLEGRADRTLRVLNKIDLVKGPPPAAGSDDAIAISAKTGEGVERVSQRIAAIAASRIGFSEEPVITQARHRQHLAAAAEALAAFLDAEPSEIELRAEDLRRAASELGRITGRIDPEQVLDQVFKRFCIGK